VKGITLDLSLKHRSPKEVKKKRVGERRQGGNRSLENPKIHLMKLCENQIEVAREPLKGKVNRWAALPPKP